mmetsp:Transcript_24416/g.33917  ORF Transcript_24416/g.33917 Transcript_24416/m.33917 type:complete len:198 (+) Transcript_24416:1-594(+)
MEDDESLECSLCLDTFTAAVITNCGHSYCASCILDFWEKKNEKEQDKKCVPCPICNRKITLLIPNYSLRAASAKLKEGGESGEDKKWNNSIEDYTKRYSRTAEEKKASVGAIVEEVQNDYALLNHATRESICYRYLVRVTAVIIGLYFVSPIDIIPEAHLGLLGYIDDLAMILLGLWLVRALVERHITLTQRRARNE